MNEVKHWRTNKNWLPICPYCEGERILRYNSIRLVECPSCKRLFDKFTGWEQKEEGK